MRRKNWVRGPEFPALNYQDPLNEGLSGWWLATQTPKGGKFYDVSGKKNDGTLTGGVTWTSKGVLFNGSNSYVATGTTINALSNNASEGTYIFDVKPIDTNDQTLWGSQQDSTTEFGFQIYTGTIYAGWYISGGDYRATPSSSNITANIWQRFAVTWKWGELTQLFKNGVLISTAAVATPGGGLTAAQNHVFGGLLWFGSTWADSYQDNHKVYSRRLNAEEIFKEYIASRLGYPNSFVKKIRRSYSIPATTTTSGAVRFKRRYVISRSIDWQNPVNKSAGLNKGLVSWWMTTPTPKGGKFYDLMKKNHGTLTNSPTWSAFTRPGGFGSLSFDGFNDYVQLPSANILGTINDFTISAWVRTTDNTLTRQVIYGEFEDGGSARNDFMLVTGKMRLDQFEPSGGSNANTTLSNNTWYHVVVTADSTNYRYYLNGVSDGVVSAEAYSGLTPTYGRIGLRITGVEDAFSGQIDDLRLFKRTLSAAEVYKLYLASRNGYPDELNRIRRYGVYQVGGAVVTPTTRRLMVPSGNKIIIPSGRKMVWN